MAGIYVHIPFCSSFCLYCDFYSELAAGKMDGWIEALSLEISRRKGFLHTAPSTLYLGGGTPSLLSEAQLRRLMAALRSGFGLGALEEATIEVNPDDVTAEKAALWREAGFDRVSMGVQAFDDDRLRWMRRRHSAREAVRAFHTLREAGFDNISLDLIFGYAMLDRDSWLHDIGEVIKLAPEHVSCYQMSIEPGSALGEMASAGRYAEPSQEVCAAEYSMLQQRLSDAGYRQYEISNFAREGFRARHNSAYWRREPYLGLGPGAHSFDGESRYWNEADLDGYIAALRSGEDAPGGSETLSAADVFNEQLMLGLRTIEGLDTAALDGGLLRGAQNAIEKAAGRGDLILEGTRIRIPAGRLFVSDAIVAALFQ